MLINRRELIRSTALGSTSLALTPSFNHLMAEDAIPNEDLRIALSSFANPMGI